MKNIAEAAIYGALRGFLRRMGLPDGISERTSYQINLFPFITNNWVSCLENCPLTLIAGMCHTFYGPCSPKSRKIQPDCENSVRLNICRQKERAVSLATHIFALRTFHVHAGH